MGGAASVSKWLARNSPLAYTFISKSPRFTRPVGMSLSAITGEARRSAATTPTTAHNTTVTTVQTMALLLLMQVEPQLLLRRWIAQRYLISGTQALGDHDFVRTSSPNFDFAFFELRPVPHISNILARLLK